MRLNRIYSWLRHPGESLSQRVVHAGFWAFALRITDRLFGLARTIILARLLSPNDFGLFGIALLAMSALGTFSQTGFSAALIQKKDDTKPYLDTAWTVQVIRGILLALIAFAIAPYVAAFFDAPAAKPILQVIGLSALFQGFTNIGVVYFQKELEFHKQFVYQFSGTLVSVGVAISAAFLLRSVWALVFGLLAGNLVRMIVSYFIHPYRPRPGFNQQQFKELFGFGKWVLGSSILVFLITQGDDALVGKVLGATALGFYQLAYRLSNISATEVTHVISQVTFPAYSKLQGNMESLLRAYNRVLLVTSFLALPMGGYILVLASELTQMLLGEKWMPIVPAVQVLCVFGVTRAINGTFGAFFQGIGMPKVLTRISAMQLLLMAAIIYPLTTNMGIAGTAIAVTLPNALVLIALFSKLAAMLNTRFLQLFKPIQIPLLACGIMVVSLISGKAFLNPQSIGGILSLSILAGVTYLGSAVLLGKLVWREGSVSEIVRKLIGFN
jgi:O-antigen/teichoic acid export membrane protein